MKVLITGAAGFLGSHLTEKFLLEGHSVVGLDDLSTGSLNNLSKFKDVDRFMFYEHDVRKPFFEVRDLGFILNFACPASPVHYQSNPVKTIETSFLGVSNMLHLANDLNIPLIQASTSEVYGDPTESPQTEDYWGNVNPIGVRSCYDEGKRAAETLCFDFIRQFKTDARVIRIFNTYGPNMAVADGRVVSNFIVQSLRGEDLTIYGTGNQTRSFCFVSDLVEAIYKLFKLPSSPKMPINIGNPSEITMIELANTIIRLTNSKSSLIHNSLPLDDPLQRNPDITRAVQVLGWSPKVSLEDGVAQTIRYFKNHI
jgi:UDP-glucuronate decarboxylase